MGLDIYLKHSADRAQALANQQQCDEYSDKLWNEVGSYDSLSEFQKDEIRKKTETFNATLNCDEWGSSNDITGVEMDSVTDPDNMFKIGYLRSSYNEGGINSVMQRINCLDLYGIFGVDRSNYEHYITPAWDDCLSRVNQVIAEMQLHMNGPMAFYDAVHVRNYNDQGVKSAAEALALLEKELETHHQPGYADYSNASGDWFLEGIKVVGVVPANKFGNGVFLLTKSETSNLEWYYKAILITRETIEYVMAQPDPENYFLSWSA